MNKHKADVVDYTIVTSIFFFILLAGLLWR